MIGSRPPKCHDHFRMPGAGTDHLSHLCRYTPQHLQRSSSKTGSESLRQTFRQISKIGRFRGPCSPGIHSREIVFKNYRFGHATVVLANRDRGADGEQWGRDGYGAQAGSGSRTDPLGDQPDSETTVARFPHAKYCVPAKFLPIVRSAIGGFSCLKLIDGVEFPACLIA